jgi:hypothetical protein
MMDIEAEYVGLRCRPPKSRTQRAPRRVNRHPQFLGERSKGLSIWIWLARHVDNCYLRHVRPMHELPKFTAPPRYGRPQRFMACYELCERPAKSLDIERAFEAQNKRAIHGGAHHAIVLEQPKLPLAHRCWSLAHKSLV